MAEVYLVPNPMPPSRPVKKVAFAAPTCSVGA
jgi:hypothetical protein